jgi:NMD protein affecting ribosome stability and mRNA decay
MTTRTPYNPSHVTHCRQCGAELTTAGQWCNAECEKTWRWAAHQYTETVNGIVVGGDDSSYEFWPYAEDACRAEWKMVAGGCFASDAEAVEWFEQEYPDWFIRGVEMRVK